MIKLNDTFSPGQEIVDPDMFAGRIADIERAVQALSRAGSCLIIYGDRGVGKTSFIEMIKLIAQGNVDLLYRHKLHKKYPTEKIRYKVVSIECDADVDTSEKVLQRLITSPEGIKQFILTKVDQLEKIVKDTKTLNFLKGISLSTSKEDKTVESLYSETSIVEIFTNLVLTIQYNILEPNEGLLIIVDEFDQVKDNRKLASLVKTLGKQRVKFAFSGIAESYETLLDGHRSIMRQLTYGRIKINAMTKEEIDSIFDIAEKYNNEQIKFNSKVREDIYNLSHGYPYFAQLFGQLCLDSFVNIEGTEGSGTINSTHLKDGLKYLIKNEPQMESAYQEVVKDNEERETMLNGIAKQISPKQLRSEVFNYCEKRGILNPKSVLTYLLGLKVHINGKDENVLIKHGKDYISFSNPMFKIYVSSRSTSIDQ